MRIGAAFPSDYLKAADLQGRPAPVTISHVSMENVGGSDHKPVLYFHGKQRGLVLNKTNANIIASVHGEETDSWAGKRIELYPTQVEFQGKMVEAIRVRHPQHQPQQSAAPAAPTAPAASAPPADHPAADPQAPTPEQDRGVPADWGPDQDIPFAPPRE